MLNQNLKLNTKIFNNDVTLKSTRQGFGEGLLEAGLANENIVGLSADLVSSTKMNLFADKFPNRYIELGIAEQNMAGVASGMASFGKIPFISSYAIFSPGRNWEQIRTNICYNNQPVKIVSSHSGLSVGPDGGSHQSLEDIALTRVLPNMIVISPCDVIEAKKATIACSKNNQPTYLRCSRNDTPVITTEETPFEIGKAEIVFEPAAGLSQVGMIATGPVLYNALIAAKKLEDKGIKVKLLNLSTIKPLDKDAILKLAKETNNIVTVEDHQIAGGMGSTIAEYLSEFYPTRIKFIGIRDEYGQSGTVEELQKYYKIDTDSIVEEIEKLI